MATSPTVRPNVELDDADELVDGTLRGDEGAWSELVSLVHPRAVRLCRRRAGARRRDDDAAHDVAARVVERLQRDRYAALRHYVRARDKYPDSSFSRWLSTVVANTYIDWVRRLPEARRVRAATGRSIEMVDVRSLSDGDDPVGGGPDVARVVEIRRILSRLAAADFPAEQRRALIIWLRGGNAVEVADELNLEGPAEAKRLLHAARTRLRRAVDRSGN